VSDCEGITSEQEQKHFRECDSQHDVQAAPAYKLRLEREAIADAREEREEKKDRCAVALGFPISASCIRAVCATRMAALGGRA